MEKIYYSIAFQDPEGTQRKVGRWKKILLFGALPAFILALLLQHIVFGLSLVLFCLSLVTGLFAAGAILFGSRTGNASRVESYKRKYYILFQENRLIVSRPLLIGTADVDAGNYRKTEGIPVAVYDLPYSEIVRITLEDYYPANPGTKRIESFKVLKLWTARSGEPVFIFPTHHGKEFMEAFCKVFEGRIEFLTSPQSVEAHYGNDRVSPSL